jgi:hypothetical protein
MNKSINALCAISFFLSSGCMAQISGSPPSEREKDCSFTYRSPVMGSYSNGNFEIFDEVLLIDVPRGVLGSAHASVGIPRCDRKNWHCLHGVAAPLYLPKPFGKSNESWSHGGFFYQIRGETSLLSRDGEMIMTVLVYDEKKRDKKSLAKNNPQAVYFFDGEMNLVGFSSDFSAVEGSADTDFLNVYWLEGNQAPLHCY